MNPLRETIRDHVHRLVKPEALDLTRPAGDPGLFGAGAETERVHGDFSAMLMGGVAALFTQMLHPLALAGVWDFSDWRDDPGGRLARTARFIALTTYGSTAAAAASVATVRRIHDRVAGALPDGTPYRANDPALLTWVHAVEADGFLRAHVAYREPGMAGARQDRYLGEMATLARRLGATDVPETRRQTADYFRAVRPQLRHDARTQAVAATLLGEASARNGLGVAIGQVLMTAGVEMMRPWAAAMHGLGTPGMRRPAIRARAAATAGVLRWALSG